MPKITLCAPEPECASPTRIYFGYVEAHSVNHMLPNYFRAINIRLKLNGMHLLPSDTQ